MWRRLTERNPHGFFANYPEISEHALGLPSTLRRRISIVRHDLTDLTGVKVEGRERGGGGKNRDSFDE